MAERNMAKLYSKIIDVFFTVEHIPVIRDPLYRISRIFPQKTLDSTPLRHEPYCFKCQKRLTQIWGGYRARVVVPEKTVKIIRNYVEKRSGLFYPSDIAEELKMDYDTVIGAMKQLAVQGKITPIDS